MPHTVVVIYAPRVFFDQVPRQEIEQTLLEVLEVKKDELELFKTKTAPPQQDNHTSQIFLYIKTSRDSPFFTTKNILERLTSLICDKFLSLAAQRVTRKEWLVCASITPCVVCSSRQSTEKGSSILDSARMGNGYPSTSDEA